MTANATAAEADGTGQEYISLPPRLLLPSTAADFPVYLKQGERYVLYAKGGDAFLDGHREKLAENGHEAAYIPSASAQDYSTYLQNNIVGILEDESIPADVRADTWGGTVRDIVSAFFQENMPREMIKRYSPDLEVLVRNAARFFTDPGALRVMAKYIAKGNDVYRHGIGTMIYTCCILHSFDVDELLLTSAGLGALLHDVGRIRIPQDVSETDPREHDERQRTLYIAHPSIGVQMCAPVPLLSESLECILFHHERMDGKGFPAGSQGDDTPFHARAVAVANAYDVFTRPQPWREPLTPFEALKRLRDDEGAIDREMFRHLVQILSRADIARAV